MTAKLPRMPLRVDRISDGVSLLTLDRPEKRNALSLELRTELAVALEEAAAGEDARCLVLTGAGTAFCAGMDVTQFGGGRAGPLVGGPGLRQGAYRRDDPAPVPRARRAAAADRGRPQRARAARRL